MPIKTSKKRKNKGTVFDDKTFDTRRAAFRAAKRDLNIPKNTQPFKVMSPSQIGWNDNKMDHRNRRLYIFRIVAFLFGKRVVNEFHIREDKKVIYSGNQGNQVDHFNAGKPPKLKKHSFFKRRRKLKQQHENR